MTTTITKEAPWHPDNKKLGNRVEDIISGSKIYLPNADLSKIQDTSEIRLKNLCNVKINGNTLEFSGFEHKKGIPIFQWCSGNRKIEFQCAISLQGSDVGTEHGYVTRGKENIIAVYNYKMDIINKNSGYLDISEERIKVEKIIIY